MTSDPSGQLCQKEVHWGLQNSEKMQGGFLGFILDLNMDIGKLLKPSGETLQPRGKSDPVLSILQAEPNK